MSFIRDVAVLDLEKIVQYIYTGDCQVESTNNNYASQMFDISTLRTGKPQ